MLTGEILRQFGAAGMLSTSRGRAVPNHVFQVEPRTAFHEQVNHRYVTGKGSLMERGGVRMGSGRVITVGIFSRVEHEAHDLDVTELCRQGEREVAIQAVGGRQQSPCILKAA